MSAKLVQQLLGKSKHIQRQWTRRWTTKLASLSQFHLSKPPFADVSFSVTIPSLQLPAFPDTFPFHRPTIRSYTRDHNKHHYSKYHKWYMFAGIYLMAEILFYFRCKYIEYYAHNISVNLVRPHISHERCHELLDLALKYAGIYANSYEGWLKLWFNMHESQPIRDLKRGNMEEFFHWGFFVEHFENNADVSPSEHAWRRQFACQAADKLEQLMNYRFEPGFNDNLFDQFNTKADILNNINIHPLFVYLCVFVLQMAGNLVMKYGLDLDYTWINDMKVWYKVTRPRPTKNLLFLHGIGIGLGPYFQFFKKLFSKNDYDAYVMIEIPYVTMNILHLLPWPLSHYSYITNKLPYTIDDYITCLHNIEHLINSNNCDWTVVGHSYGTMVANKMHVQMDKKTTKLVLIDPACLCLSHPSTVTAFITKMDGDNEITMDARKLLAKDIMISCNLRKYFHWYDWVVYPEDMTSKHIVITANNDDFVPLQLIRDGIQNVNSKDGEIVHHSIDANHGDWIWDEQCIERVVNSL